MALLNLFIFVQRLAAISLAGYPRRVSESA